MNRKFKMENLLLSPIFKHVRRMMSIFTNIYFLRVNREFNSRVDAQSREGIQLKNNSWVVKGSRDASIQNETIPSIHGLCTYIFT